MIKVAIGLPLYQENQICKGTADSLNAVMQNNKDSNRKLDLQLNRAYGNSSVFSRNICASTLWGINSNSTQTWQKMSYDYYLSIDGDMIFSLNSIIRLIDKFEALRTEGKNIGIIGGAYQCRTGNHPNKIMAGCFGNVPGICPEHKYVDFETWDCVECDWCASGFMLISKEVFEGLPYPWFQAPPVSNGECRTLINEEVFLCMQAKQKLNKSVWIDCTNRIYHIVH